jgi:endo-alpha-1,4-polygalactosaminidase (GH114 family)
MIGRRGFALGAASLLAATRARSEVIVNDTVLPDPDQPKKPRRDIPFTPIEQIPNHRQLMRDIIVALSDYAKKRNPRFVILVRNGAGLLIKETREWKLETLRDPDGASADKYAKVGAINRPFVKAIDGMVMDGLSFGAVAYGKPTTESRSRSLLAAGAALKKEGRSFLAIEYCDDKGNVALAEANAAKAGALTYIDRDGDKLLGRIPSERPPRENPAAVSDFAKLRNYLPMMRSDGFGSRAAWVGALANTNYDMLLLETFWRETESLTFSDVRQLKYKKLGTDRLVLGVLPVGRARDTRFYWKSEWKLGEPSFLVASDPDDAAETVIKYWDDKWKEIVGKYMQGIVDLGVDGVMFDHADAYLYFEDLMPLQ